MEDIISETIAKFYGENGQLTSLGSCQDLNYRLTTIQGRKYVVKVVKPISTLQKLVELVTNQHVILLHLSKKCPDFEFPVPNTTKDHVKTFEYVEFEGETYLLQLLSYVEGNLLSKLKYYAPETLFSFGAMIAKVHIALATCNVQLHGQTQWDPRRSMEVIRGFVSEADPLLTLSQQLFDTITKSSPAFRAQVLHGDLAPYNVLINASRLNCGQPIISGVIDFGDVTHGWLVGDLSIAIAPLLGSLPEHNQHPLKTTLHVLKGYLSLQSLLEDEARALWPLLILRVILLRLSIAHLLQEDPSNAYLEAENIENAKLLESVLQIPFVTGVQAILTLCGFPITPLSVPSMSFHTLFDNRVMSLEWKKVDLSCESEVYRQPAQWLTEHNLSTYFATTVTSNGSVGYVEKGKPWLFKTKLRSVVAPKTIATFDLFHIPIATVAAGGAAGGNGNSVSLVIPKVPGDIVQNTCRKCTVQDDDQVSYHAIEVLCSSQWKMRVIAFDHSTQITYDPVSHQLHITQTDSQSRYVTIGVQYYRPDLILDCNHSGEMKTWPPLFCTLFDWEYLYQPLSLLLPLPQDINSLAEYDLGRASALTKRTQYAANIQELYYSSLTDHLEYLPPLITRGYGGYLYSADGRALLDMVNNVAVIGHSHPAITQAVTQQLTLLNTNSRFLYPQMGDFAAEIVKTMPPEAVASGKLNEVIFVNSGSEATDLALRIARTVISYRQHVQRQAQAQPEFKWCRDVISLQGGYHGVTTASDEVSTTLNDNPQALESRPEYIHLVPMPNTYRGIHAKVGTQEEQASKYVEHVQAKIAELTAQDRTLAAFICEPLSGNAGGVLLPPGYLSQVYAAVHAVGGLCICDEVQTGYGRLGSAFWGFMTSDHALTTQLPDIVTVAKAAGNGHPLGYVVLSEALAEEFYAVQGSFFSSAGGGPVSCAIGRTVLKTVQDEGLMHNARVVGVYIHDKLLALREKHSKVIGYIHGQGLYQGIEIIASSAQDSAESLAPPGTKEAALICRRLIQLGVICHNTGDYSNVLKVKPPLCFSHADADFFVAMLDKVCSEGW